MYKKSKFIELNIIVFHSTVGSTRFYLRNHIKMFTLIRNSFFLLLKLSEVISQFIETMFSTYQITCFS